tara:strand:- start:251 stop:520 length:270 start_codon:yes stop_codon:yes gene_type:complete
MWWWIFFILFMLISIFSSITLFYALRRINQYEDLIEQFQQIILFATNKMKSVDASGHYEADDETGFFFQQLKELQLLLDEIFETEDTNE